MKERKGPRGEEASPEGEGKKSESREGRMRRREGRGEEKCMFKEKGKRGRALGGGYYCAMEEGKREGERKMMSCS